MHRHHPFVLVLFFGVIFGKKHKNNNQRQRMTQFLYVASRRRRPPFVSGSGRDREAKARAGFSYFLESRLAAGMVVVSLDFA